MKSEKRIKKRVHGFRGLHGLFFIVLSCLFSCDNRMVIDILPKPGDDIIEEQNYVEEKDKNIVSITVTKLPAKTVYIIGEGFDPKGMTVIAIYDDDSASVVINYTISGYNTDTLGIKTITVTYEGKKDEFDVRVTLGLELVSVPAVENYNVGSGTVNLSAFEIGKYQVTQQQWFAIMTESENNATPSFFTSDPAENEIQEKRPVERITWFDAIEFCNILSQKEGFYPHYIITNINRNAEGSIDNAVVTLTAGNGYCLPTEAQWEYACRAGSTAELTVNDSNAWYNPGAGGKTHQVGLKEPNEWDLYDILGNIHEWCWDWHGAAYPYGGNPDPLGGFLGSIRLLRGGAYNDLSMSSATRNGIYPENRGSNIGFRVARKTTSLYTVTFNSNGGSYIPFIAGTAPGTKLNAPTPPTKSGTWDKYFNKWYRDSELTTLWNFENDAVTSNIILYAKWGYDLGDTGPGGGKIFYVDKNGFTVQGHSSFGSSYTAYYLEAAPVNVIGGYGSDYYMAWADQSIEVNLYNVHFNMIGRGVETPNTTQMNYIKADIGKGRFNTAAIMVYQPTTTYIYAAKACNNYSQSNLPHDWFLPSIGELYLLYNNREYVGNLGTYYYWSSSQAQGWYGYEWNNFYLCAWFINFGSGNRDGAIKLADRGSENEVRVRPIRAL